MRILVLNAGSSSLKYKLYDFASIKELASGIIEQIGIDGYRSAVFEVEERLRAVGIGGFAQLDAIGHRVVHGGEQFVQSVLIDEDVKSAIASLIPLAPLHNPANLQGIEISMSNAPEVPQVAVFDTAFHQSIPDYAYRYALPEESYTKMGVRRYGFHGTSHQYVSREAARILGKNREDINLITLHLGNGVSVCAIQKGKSIDTSMGFTPLEGLVMGTRCGDIDPAILFYLSKNYGYTIDELSDMLNKQSGLLGLCGENDMRQIHLMISQGDKKAKLAYEIFCYRIIKYIGAYMAVLGSLDAVVFTGGIGENDAITRSKIQDNFSEKLKFLTITTDEELEIALQTMSVASK